jgi:hypothetical protein
MYPLELNVARLDNPTTPATEQDFMEDKIVIGETNFIDEPVAMTDLCFARYA